MMEGGMQMRKVLIVTVTALTWRLRKTLRKRSPQPDLSVASSRMKAPGHRCRKFRYQLTPTQTETTTDSQGRYTLRGLAPGTYRVAAHGQTDQNGVYFSDMLAPGKYLVLANSAPVDSTPESIGKLWRSRSHAQEVEIAANVTAQVTLPPVALE